MRTREKTRHVFHAGAVVELWENSEAAFGCDERALAGYARDGDWEMLFNGIMLSVDRQPSLVDGIFKSPLSLPAEASA